MFAWEAYLAGFGSGVVVTLAVVGILWVWLDDEGSR